MINVKILSDGIPGHFNQSLGVCKLLKEELNLSVEIIDIYWRAYAIRSFCKIIGRFLCKDLTILKSKLIVLFFKKIDLNKADLLIAAGGNTFILNAALAKLNNIPNIQLGSPRGIPSDLFSVHLTSQRFSEKANNIVFEVTPNKYSPLDFPVKKNFSNKKNFLLLFGGEGIAYKFSIDEVKILIENLNIFTNKNNAIITCITSRRTGEELEILLKNNLLNLSQQSIWYLDDGKNADLSDAFSKCDHIFVTEDSSMMIAESISTGIGVTTIYPTVDTSPKRYKNQINSYLKKGFISRLHMKENIFINKQNSNKDIVRLARDKLRKNIMDRVSLKDNHLNL